MFRLGYMARNIRSNQKHRGNDENNMGKRGILSMKGNWDKNLLVVLLQQESKICEFTHFLLCDYWAPESA